MSEYESPTESFSHSDDEAHESTFPMIAAKVYPQTFCDIRNLYEMKVYFGVKLMKLN